MDTIETIRAMREIYFENHAESAPQGFSNQDTKLTPAALEMAACVGFGIGRSAAGEPVIEAFSTTDKTRSKVRAAWKRYLDDEFPVLPMGLPACHVATGTGGEVGQNKYEGRVVGGKAVMRHGTNDVLRGTMLPVLENESGRLVVPSNNHVLVDERGLDAELEQHSLRELRSNQIFGRTMAWQQISLAPHGRFNTIDASYARLEPEWEDRAEPGVVAGLGQLTGVARAAVGDVVCKNGSTTGLTTSTVSHERSVVRVKYSWPGVEEAAIFDDCYVVDNALPSGPFALPGDSGSPVVSRSGGLAWVGAHFAGSPSRAIFCAADNVCRVLGVRLPGA